MAEQLWIERNLQERERIFTIMAPGTMKGNNSIAKGLSWTCVRNSCPPQMFRGQQLIVLILNVSQKVAAQLDLQLILHKDTDDV